MKKCPGCSFENSDDSRFCNSCGRDISQSPRTDALIRCPKCSNLNPPGTRFCNRCGQPLTQEAADQVSKEKSHYANAQKTRRTNPVVVVLAIILVLGALAIIAPMSCSFPFAAITADVATPVPTKTTPTSARIIAKIGEETSVGSVSYTVQKVERSDTVGGDYIMATAKGTYLLVTMEIKNNSKESLTISDSFFTILYGGKEYSADSVATMYADSANSLWYDQLNPDLITTGVIAFDVTDTVAYSTDTQLRVQTDFWGTQTGIISLAR